MARAFSELVEFARERGLDLDAVATRALLEISNMVIARTPVDTGRAKANWQPSLNAPSAGTVEATDKSGQATESKVGAVLVGQAVGYEFFLVNNLPYAGVLEYGQYGRGPGATDKTTRDGYSIQAPYGMLRVSISEWERRVREALAKVR